VADLIRWLTQAIGDVCPEGRCTDEAVAQVNSLISWATETLDHLVRNLCPDFRCGDEAIAEINSLLSWLNETLDQLVRNLCPGLRCGEEAIADVTTIVQWAYQAVLKVVNDLCPDLSSCTNPVVDLVLEVFDSAWRTLCPSGSLDLCYTEYQEEVVRRVNQAIGTYCPNLECPSETAALVVQVVNDRLKAVCGSSGGSGTQACVQLAEKLVNDVFLTLCPQNGQSPECVGELGTAVTKLVNDALNLVCSSPYASGAQACLRMAEKIVNDVFLILCPQSGQSPECVGELGNAVVKLLNDTIGIVCRSPYTSGAEACVKMAEKIVNDVFLILCPRNGQSPECVGELGDAAMELVSDVLNLVCSSRNSSGAQACVDMAEELINDVFRIVCPQSGQSPECLAELSDRAIKLINGALNAVCNSPYSSGAQACVDMAEELINDVFRIVCPQSGQSPECLAELSGEALKLLNEALKPVCTSTGSSGLQACLEMTQQIVRDLLAVICSQETDIVRCLDNLSADGLKEAARLVGEVCRSSGGSVAEECVAFVEHAAQVYVGMIEELIESLLADACPEGRDACIQTLLGLVGDAVNLVCPSESLEECDPFAGGPVADFLKEVIAVLCPHGRCAEPLTALLEDLVHLARQGGDEALEVMMEFLVQLARFAHTTTTLVEATLGNLSPGVVGSTLQKVVSLTFVTEEGSPLSGALVNVYLSPDDKPCVYQPPLLAGGTASASGLFQFGLPAWVTEETLDDRVNAIILAVSPDGHRLINWDTMLPIGRGYEETISAAYSPSGEIPGLQSVEMGDLAIEEVIQISRASRVSGPDPDGGDPRAPTSSDGDPESDNELGDEVEGASRAPAPGLSCGARTGTSSGSTSSGGGSPPSEGGGSPPSDGPPSDGTNPPPSDGGDPGNDDYEEADGPAEAEIDGNCYDPYWQYPGYPEYGCAAHKDTTYRWKKVVALHSAAGLRTRFDWKDAKETRSQIAIRYAGRAWSAGGVYREAQTRGTGTWIGAVGEKHKYVVARYRQEKWQYCYRGSCHKKWIPIYWQGGLKFGTDKDPYTPGRPSNQEWEITLKPGATQEGWYTKSKQSAQWSNGFKLQGLELSSGAGYSSATRLEWALSGSCQKARFLFGWNTHPPNSPVIYAASNC
jgi:hypothetical protein